MLKDMIEERELLTNNIANVKTTEAVILLGALKHIE